MNDIVSVFKNVHSPPIKTTDWKKVLGVIKSDKYKEAILEAQKVKSDIIKYREAKKKLPAVTFCGTFKDNREKGNIIDATGFIIPDLDHIKDVESVFSLLKQDENIWFAFRSPSGEGIKCGIRAKGIRTDEDIKRLYSSGEYYFKSVYNIEIDPACKDISRLTFISYDPNLFINPEPYYFDINKWAPSNKQPDYILPTHRKNGWKEKYGLKVIESCCEEILKSQPGEQHHIRLKKSRLIGGFIGEFINEDFALVELEKAVKDSGAKNMAAAMKTVKDGLEYGKASPIQVKEHPTRPTKNVRGGEYYFDIEEVESLGKQSKQAPQNSAEVSDCKQNSSKVSKD